MRIFLSYASEDRDTAARINYALVARGHDVFFDRADLVAGHQFDGSIAEALQASDLFVFLISPDSVEAGRYTRTELQMANRRWPNPSGSVLPVLLRPTERSLIPPYLCAVNLLEIEGEAGAEVAEAVARLARARPAVRRFTPRALAVGLLLAVIAVAAGWMLWHRETPAAAPSPGDGAVRVPPTPTATPEPAPALEGALRRRARAVAPIDGGYLLALASPHELRRMTDDHQQSGSAIPLPGEPSLILDLPTQYIVVTRRPGNVVVLSRKDLALVTTIAVKAPASATGPVSSDIRSIALDRNILWAATGDGEGRPALIRERAGQWDFPSWVAGAITSGEAFPQLSLGGNGLRLRLIDGTLWGLSRNQHVPPSTLYRITGAVRLDAVDGQTVRTIACACDLGEGTSGRLLLLSCDHELLEVGMDGTLPKVERSFPPAQVAAGEIRMDERIARDGPAIFAAITVGNGPPPGTPPGRTSVVRFDDGGTKELGRVERASVVSFALSPRSAIVVVRHADGTYDVASFKRHD